MGASDGSHHLIRCRMLRYVSLAAFQTTGGFGAVTAKENLGKLEALQAGKYAEA